MAKCSAAAPKILGRGLTAARVGPRSVRVPEATPPQVHAAPPTPATDPLRPPGETPGSAPDEEVAPEARPLSLVSETPVTRRAAIWRTIEKWIARMMPRISPML